MTDIEDGKVTVDIPDNMTLVEKRKLTTNYILYAVGGIVVGLVVGLII